MYIASAGQRSAAQRITKKKARKFRLGGQGVN